MLQVHADNKITSSKYYGEILKEYNDRFARDGKVQLKKFHAEFVLPRIKVSYELLRRHIKQFETSAGLIAARAAIPNNVNPAIEANRAIIALKDSAIATREGIARALNIGTEALQEIIDHPELLSPKDRASLLFQAMKAQDSRIGAAAKIRHDMREQVKFSKTFSRAAFVGGEDDS